MNNRTPGPHYLRTFQQNYSQQVITLAVLRSSVIRYDSICPPVLSLQVLNLRLHWSSFLNFITNRPPNHYCIILTSAMHRIKLQRNLRWQVTAHTSGSTHFQTGNKNLAHFTDIKHQGQTTIFG